MASNGQHLTEGLLSAQKVFGYKVENPRGEGLGRIEDIIISTEDGQIAYAVVSFGGVLSLGNKLFAFPWSALRMESAKKKVILNLDRKTLTKARGFEKDRWPDMSDWNQEAPAPAPAAEAAPSVAPAPREGDARKDAPPPEVLPAASGQKQIDHWGKSWQGHGLDRA